MVNKKIIGDKIKTIHGSKDELNLYSNGFIGCAGIILRIDLMIKRYRIFAKNCKWSGDEQIEYGLLLNELKLYYEKFRTKNG